MFSGIVEKVAFFKGIKSGLCVIENVFEDKDYKIGDSVAVNGVCLTIEKTDKSQLFFSLSSETLKRTNLKFLSLNDRVNMERALTLNSRIGGHLLSGHVDTMTKLKSLKKIKDSFIMEFFYPSGYELKNKGSVALNGISLTCYDINAISFKVSVIKHTMENTNLKFISKKDFLNLEIDLLSKYASKESGKKISLEFLKENGFF